MSLNFYYMSFNISNNICMLWNCYYMSFNFLNNIYMLGAHFIYVTLSKHPTTWKCFWFLSAVLLDPCHHPTRYPISQCHNAIIHVLWLGVTIIFQLRHHRETTCHSVGDGPHLTVTHPARQDMCQVTLYSKTNNTNSFQTSRVDLCVFLFLYRVSNRRSWKPSARLFTQRGHECRRQSSLLQRETVNW